MSLLRDRMSDDGAELYPPTADGIRAWVAGSRRPPRREEVVAVVRSLVRDGHMARADLAVLALDYPELRGAR